MGTCTDAKQEYRTRPQHLVAPSRARKTPSLTPSSHVSRNQFSKPPLLTSFNLLRGDAMFQKTDGSLERKPFSAGRVKSKPEVSLIFMVVACKSSV